VYLRQNTPALASSSRRGGLATEPRPGVRLSAGTPGPGERRCTAAGWGPPASRAGRPNAGARGRLRGAGDAGERRSMAALEVRAEALAGARPL